MVVEDLGLRSSATQAARSLLGCYLIRETSDGLVKVRIVETEAYTEEDPASHSFNGPTPRSTVMFGDPGYWYVYRCYGIHWMLNVVTGPTDRGEAVLIRAAEPLDGKELMEQRRETAGVSMTDGPGKLTEALAIDKSLNGVTVRNERLKLAPGSTNRDIYESPRVGINVAEDRFWRFYYDCEYCSDVTQNDLGRRRN